MKMNKKAQQSRNDLVVWYAAAFAIALVSVGVLYWLGMIGEGLETGSLLEENRITGAAVIEDPGVEEPPAELNETENHDSSLADKG